MMHSMSLCARLIKDWDSWTLDQKFYSLGETFAHLVYLVNEGRITMTINKNKRRFYVDDQWDVKPRGDVI